jgi:uncharacterized zinc-type alcohol dehydrogenase-like protein
MQLTFPSSQEIAMCTQCQNEHHESDPQAVDAERRQFLGYGSLLTAGLAAASVFSASASAAELPPPNSSGVNANPLGATPFPVTAWGAAAANAPFAPIEIKRRALGPNDVLLDVLYCGICHSDIHSVHGDWRAASYPIVPGHEIIGRVIAVGKAVKKFRIGDVGGVGCMVDACGECENCLADREQNCLNGTTFTYGASDRVLGGLTYGGYSDKMVVAENFVIRIPPGADLAAMAPLLCAGVTTFSPMQHWKLESGQRVGVIGLGGLGHIAVKLAAARKAEITVFTTSPEKLNDAKRLGAQEAILWNDEQAFARLSNHFDLLISTVPQAYNMQPFMNLLKLDATLVNVGALGNLQGLNGMAQGFGRKSLAGSMIGGIRETQEVVDYCAARHIQADIELIRPEQIDAAYKRVMGKEARYRFVIDFTEGKTI